MRGCRACSDRTNIPRRRATMRRRILMIIIITIHNCSSSGGARRRRRSASACFVYVSSPAPESNVQFISRPRSPGGEVGINGVHVCCAVECRRRRRRRGPKEVLDWAATQHNMCNIPPAINKLFDWRACACVCGLLPKCAPVHTLRLI